MKQTAHDVTAYLIAATILASLLLVARARFPPIAVQVSLAPVHVCSEPGVKYTLDLGQGDGERSAGNI